jgi:hypothetical protein
VCVCVVCGVCVCACVRVCVCVCVFMYFVWCHVQANRFLELVLRHDVGVAIAIHHQPRLVIGQRVKYVGRAKYVGKLPLEAASDT